MADQKIKFNLRGILFETTKETIRGSEYLSAYVKRWHNVDSPIFIDRSARLFDHVLCYLSDPYYPFPNKYRSELDFYGIDYIEEEDFKEVTYIEGEARVDIINGGFNFNICAYQVKVGDIMKTLRGDFPVMAVIKREIPEDKICIGDYISMYKETSGVQPISPYIKTTTVYRFILSQGATIICTKKWHTKEVTCQGMEVSENPYSPPEVYTITRSSRGLQPITSIIKGDEIVACTGKYTKVTSLAPCMSHRKTKPILEGDASYPVYDRVGNVVAIHY